MKDLCNIMNQSKKSKKKLKAALRGKHSHPYVHPNPICDAIKLHVNYNNVLTTINDKQDNTPLLINVFFFIPALTYLLSIRWINPLIITMRVAVKSEDFHI